MKTVAQVIADSAVETEAPTSFVQSVTEMFTGKGIALDEDAGPYEAAIRDTFRCEQKIRVETTRAREGIERLQERLTRLGESWERQLAEVDRLKQTMRDQAALLRAQRAPRITDASTAFVVPGPTELN